MMRRILSSLRVSESRRETLLAEAIILGTAVVVISVVRCL